MAPMIEAMMPGLLAGSRYMPTARPRKPATNEPAMPSSIVTMMPPGSLPGMNSLASAPTIRPTMSMARMCMMISSYPLEKQKAGRAAACVGAPAAHLSPSEEESWPPIDCMSREIRGRRSR